MDRSLDDVISDRQRGGNRGGRNRRRNNWPRDGARKTNSRDDDTNIDTDWLHDKYQDDEAETRPSNRVPRNRRNLDRYSPEADLISEGAKLRVDNLHYDLTEDDLEDLFTRIGPVKSLSLRYDRAGRSDGTAFVTYVSLASAHKAIREFDGANANGQPIRLTLMPSSSFGRRNGNGEPRNPFDTAVKPSRSLFDRVSMPREKGRDRSRSPGAPRRTDTRKPPPEGVDRYVPDDGGAGRLTRSRSRSPIRRGGRGRRDDSRRNGRRGDRDDDGGRKMVNGRPRMTQEELDKEMEDYWGSTSNANGATTTTDNNNGVTAPQPSAAAMEDEDIDMIE